MLFFKPTWKSRNPEKAAKAIDTLEDQQELAKAALGAASEDLRLRAIRKLTLQDVLAQIALTDVSREIRCSAVSRLEDKAVLEKIALTDESQRMRYLAVSRLTDKDVLEKIAEEDDHWKVQARAYSQLGEDERAKYLEAQFKIDEFKDGPNRNWWQIQAVRDIKNPELLCNLASMEDLDAEVRLEAAKRVNDIDILVGLLDVALYRNPLIDKIWMLMLSQKKYTLLPCMVETLSRRELIRQVPEILKQDDMGKWLLECPVQIVDKLLTPETFDGKREKIKRPDADSIILFLRELYRENQSLQSHIESFNGLELIEATEYLWIESSNADDSFGFPAMPSATIKIDKTDTGNVEISLV